MKLPGAKRWLLAAVLVALAVSYFSGQLNRYYLGLVIDIGINIILAVSLNLVNGHTGQFSLGHAGFMAVGAYSSAAFTTYLSKSFLPVLGGFHSTFANELFFLLALLTAGIAAAAAGLLVG